MIINELSIFDLEPKFIEQVSREGMQETTVDLATEYANTKHVLLSD